MVRKKLDNRIRVLIENGVQLGHRTMFVIVGDKGRDQVVILHHMLSKATVRARPNVLWCYKKELDFSSHRKKRMKAIQKKIKAGKLNVDDDSPFELFVASTNVRYCYYAETHKILGNTYGMCVLQDFESLTPNLLARTIETVEGGGLVILLLRTVSSLRQLYTMAMDVHERYRTEAHQDIVGRFNERFLLSLASCSRCLVVDDQLAVLPISSQNLEVEPVMKAETKVNQELLDLKESLRDTQPVGVLVSCCVTIDQAKAVLKFIEAVAEKTLRSTVSLTAARGRGKSAALGLSIAAAVAFGYSNIFVTSPSPENLKTLFEFIFKGFDALEYQEHLDYDLIQSTNPEFNKAVVRVNIFREHRQTIQYIHPTDANKLAQAELLVIDEAAAIPLPYVKNMLGPYLVFLASTINGYEGTGRSLSLKLLQQLRAQTVPIGASAEKNKSQAAATGRVLHEVTLNESIRYKPGDAVEKWLTDLLCLDASSVKPILSGCPPPDQCELYYINRDTLFSYHRASEAFLQRLVALYVASHYKNSPNDLQMISDAPQHHLFCLLGPVDPNKKTLPEVLVVIQVCLEGHVSKSSAASNLAQGKKVTGDLIPWTVAQQFQDQDFPCLSGARIVRIATHPDYMGMGYGTRALSLLKQYYEFRIPCVEEETIAPEMISSLPDDQIGLLEETLEPRRTLPPLLLKLGERPPEHLHYLGVAYGLTISLLKFWKRAGFVPVYLRQTTNDLTGEHSCIMLYVLQTSEEQEKAVWLQEFGSDFRRRFLSLLGYQFSTFPAALAFSVLQNKYCEQKPQQISQEELDLLLTKYDIKRLEMYANNLVDYHLVIDLLPVLARLYFLKQLGDLTLSPVQTCILVGLGLQHKTVDTLAAELELMAAQLLGLFNRIIRKVMQFLMRVLETRIGEQFVQPRVEFGVEAPAKSMDEELEEAAAELKKKQREELKKLQKEDLRQYVVKGSEQEWSAALAASSMGLGKKKKIISLKRGEKRELQDHEIPDAPVEKKSKKKKKKRNKYDPPE